MIGTSPLWWMERSAAGTLVVWQAVGLVRALWPVALQWRLPAGS